MDYKAFIEYVGMKLTSRYPDFFMQKPKSYREAYKLADRYAKAVNETIDDYLTLGEQIDREFIDTIFIPSMNRQFMLSRDWALASQEALNKRLELGIKPIEASSRGIIEGSAKQILESTTPVMTVKQNVAEFGGKVISDSVRKNSDFQAKSGLKIRVERVNGEKGLSGGRQCKYCDEWEGSYSYPNIPGAVWGFHDGCTCKLTYINETKGKVEQIH